jgi:hypothetical protein
MNFKFVSTLLLCAMISATLAATKGADAGRVALSPVQAENSRTILSLLNQQVGRLTPDQEAKATRIVNKYIVDHDAAKGDWTILTRIRDKYHRDINAILTPEQRQHWKASIVRKGSNAAPGASGIPVVPGNFPEKPGIVVKGVVDLRPNKSGPSRIIIAPAMMGAYWDENKKEISGMQFMNPNAPQQFIRYRVPANR